MVNGVLFTKFVYVSDAFNAKGTWGPVLNCDFLGNPATAASRIRFDPQLLP